jgi:hypothetical protein
MKVEQVPNLRFVTGRLNSDEDEWDGLRIRVYRDSFNLYFGKLHRVWVGIEKQYYNSLWETLKKEKK